MKRVGFALGYGKFANAREMADLMRQAGERVSYHGKYVNFDNVGLAWTPARRSVPLYFPATSRTGLRLAGELGDGVVLNAVGSPEYTANAIKIMRQSAEASGRDWSSFVVAQIVNCSVEDTHAAAIDAMPLGGGDQKWIRSSVSSSRDQKCWSASRTSDRRTCRYSTPRSPAADSRAWCGPFQTATLKA
jgi:alkanesulfonate monooxygenase SsuD/methylene tetrahydromethanopterin reductase-like flavin-dependent oxidoreductase (luciferase family)